MTNDQDYGGLGVQATQPAFERVIRRVFKIRPSQLERLGIFLLAHALVDRALARQLAASDEARRRGGRDLLEAEKTRISRSAINSKIGPRIKRLRKRGVLSPSTAGAAKRVNDERNRFLHGTRGYPTWGGKTIFDEDSWRACMTDALAVWLEYARKIRGSSR